MPSRQDQLHSHQFLMQRVVAALITHQPDSARSPLRQASGAAIASVLVAALALGGTAAYAAVADRRKVNWQDATKVFVEKETGAQYVYSEADRKLHPVLNYASAMLIVNSPQARTVTARRSALAKAPLGATWGIPSAPNSLPSTSDMIVKPWTLCSTTTHTSSGTRSVLAVGTEASGGYVLSVPKPGSTADALLISSADGTSYLVYDNHRFRIPQPQPVLVAFGWSGRQPAPLATAVINAVPAGPDLKPSAVPDRGTRSGVLNVKIGQMYRSQARPGVFQSAVALADGVVDISDVQARLLNTDPATTTVPITLDAAQYASLPRSRNRLDPATGGRALPTEVPQLVNAERSVCLTIAQAADGVAAVRVDGTAPDGPPTGETGAVNALADRVSVPRGRGVLVESAASPDADRGTGTVSVITDSGLRYAVASREVLANLGYGKVAIQHMPAELVSLLPAGPTLDPGTARNPVLATAPR